MFTIPIRIPPILLVMVLYLAVVELLGLPVWLHLPLNVAGVIFLIRWFAKRRAVRRAARREEEISIMTEALRHASEVKQ